MFWSRILQNSRIFGDCDFRVRGREREKEKARMERGGRGGLEIEICATEESKCGWEVGWVSFHILSGYVNREDRVTQRECECEWGSSQYPCIPGLHSVGTEMPLSEANELRATSLSHPKWASVWLSLLTKSTLSKYKVTVGRLFAAMSICYWFAVTTELFTLMWMLIQFERCSLHSYCKVVLPNMYFVIKRSHVVKDLYWCRT